MRRLKEIISEKEKEYIQPQNNKVSRVVYVPISRELTNLESLYREWFPLRDSILEDIYCWMPVDESSSSSSVIKKDIVSIWRKIMGANTLKDITEKGYLLMDSSTHVIFLVDLTQEKSLELLKSTKKKFDDLISQWPSQVRVFFSCIAILRNYRDEDGEVNKPTDISEFQKISCVFDRLYTVDIANSNGTFISKPSDLFFLLGQLLYYLSTRPLKESNFNEWMTRISAKNGHTSAFSTVSLVLPIDYILETCLIVKGSELLESSIFSQPNNDRYDFYLNKFINENEIASYESLKNTAYTENLMSQLEYPEGLIKKSFSKSNGDLILGQIDKRLEVYEEISLGLSEKADKHRKALEERSSNVSRRFRYKLLDYSDDILINETGSALLLKRFFYKLREHLQKFNLKSDEKNEVQLSYYLNRLKEESRKAPTIQGIISRVVVLTILAGINLLNYLNSESWISIGVFFVIIMLVGFMAYKWISVKNRIETLCMNIESIIHKKWKDIVGEMQDDILGNIVNECVEYLDEASNEMDQVIKRFEFIIDYGKELYEPDYGTDSPFWIYLVSSRSEALDFKDLIKSEKKLVPLGFLKEENHSLELWNRISFNQDDDLNDWEQDILARAAIEYLPDCAPIINLSVCEVLERNDEKTKNIITLVANYCEPFTVINKLHLDSFGYLELPSDRCEEVTDKLKKVIEQQFKNIEISSSESMHRLSFFSFADGIDIEEIATMFNE